IGDVLTDRYIHIGRVPPPLFPWQRKGDGPSGPQWAKTGPKGDICCAQKSGRLPSGCHPGVQRLFWGLAREARGMHDPRTVAAIVDALRQSYGDDIARFSLQGGLPLDALINALLNTPLKNRDVARLITAVLQSGDFDITPDFTAEPSHVKYVYDPPGSLRVVDIIMLTERRTYASSEIRLRLRT